MSLVCEVCCGSSVHVINEARLRGIKMGLVNVGNYAHRWCNIYSPCCQCGKTLKLEVYWTTQLFQLEKALFSNKISHQIENRSYFSQNIYFDQMKSSWKPMIYYYFLGEEGWGRGDWTWFCVWTMLVLLLSE